MGQEVSGCHEPWHVVRVWCPALCATTHLCPQVLKLRLSKVQKIYETTTVSELVFCTLLNWLDQKYKSFTVIQWFQPPTFVLYRICHPYSTNHLRHFNGFHRCRLYFRTSTSPMSTKKRALQALYRIHYLIHLSVGVGSGYPQSSSALWTTRSKPAAAAAFAAGLFTIIVLAVMISMPFSL